MTWAQHRRIRACNPHCPCFVNLYYPGSLRIYGFCTAYFNALTRIARCPHTRHLYMTKFGLLLVLALERLDKEDPLTPEAWADGM